MVQSRGMLVRGILVGGRTYGLESPPLSFPEFFGNMLVLCSLPGPPF